jgi:hypothetical protein
MNVGRTAYRRHSDRRGPQPRINRMRVGPGQGRARSCPWGPGVRAAGAPRPAGATEPRPAGRPPHAPASGMPREGALRPLRPEGDARGVRRAVRSHDGGGRRASHLDPPPDRPVDPAARPGRPAPPRGAHRVGEPHAVGSPQMACGNRVSGDQQAAVSWALPAISMARAICIWPASGGRVEGRTRRPADNPHLTTLTQPGGDERDVPPITPGTYTDMMTISVICRGVHTYVPWDEPTLRTDC